MGSFDVAPFVPMSEEKSGSDVCFDLTFFCLFILSLVAGCVGAVRIDVGEKREPLSIWRPDWRSWVR